MATLTINKFSCSVDWSYSKTITGVGDSLNNNNLTFSKTMSNGTGSGKAQKLYVAQLSISGSSTTSVDFSGSLTDFFGDALVFTKIKAVYIEHATSGATNPLHIYGNFMSAEGANTQPLNLGGTTPTAKWVVKPGDVLFFGGSGATGYTVTNTTADTITFDNQDSGAITVNVVVVGE